MQFLRQSTACTVQITCIGTDGTRQTSLTISQTDIKLSKNGGTYATKNDATNSIHDAAGNYKVALNATDTATLGRLTLDCVEASIIFVPIEFLVVTANVYDSLCGTSTLNAYVTNKTGYSLAVDQSSVTIGTVTNLTNKSGMELASAGVTAILNKLVTGCTVGSLGYTLELIRKIATNKWAVNGTTKTIYDDNGTTPLLQFTLDDADEPTTRTPV
jgi:hypothetical protein